MVNYIIIAIGQCGNQLSFELLNMIYEHCLSNKDYFEFHQRSVKEKRPLSGSSAAAFSRGKLKPSKKYSGSSSASKSKMYYYCDETKAIGSNSDDCQSRLFDSFFRPDDSFSLNQKAGSKEMCTARVICLDTEPKVIDACLSNSQSHFSSSSLYSWHYDSLNIAYKHSGAGNNWALGYSMVTGDFLDKALNRIRSEIERCDELPVLIYVHSLAGGTGSGLGTHLIESSYDMFSNCFHYHILVSPHSFSEVIVQYYNTLLCLSKIYQNSNGILIFDNESAQLLCKQMKFIEKPVLKDLNQTISNHLVSLFLPKKQRFSDISYFSASSPHDASRHYTYLNDDLTFLCSHPSYRFFNVKLTPQTSIDSIDFTYDSWFSLTNTIQRMLLSGTLSERNISHLVKRLGRNDDDTVVRRFSNSLSLPYSSKSKSRSNDAYADNDYLSSVQEDEAEEDENLTVFRYPSSAQLSSASSSSLIKSLASVIVCHGEGSEEAIGEINENLKDTTDLSDDVRSTVSSRLLPNYNANKPKLFEEYLSSHSSHLSFSSSSFAPVHLSSTKFLLNQYQRSSTVLSNDQSILPLLQRTLKRSSEMFAVKAYVHQYLTNGLEYDDFIDSFQWIYSTIQAYSEL
jgi:hypothetical protein